MSSRKRKTPFPLELPAWIAIDSDGFEEHVLGISLSKAAAAAQVARTGGGFLIGGRFLEAVKPEEAPE